MIGHWRRQNPSVQAKCGKAVEFRVYVGLSPAGTDSTIDLRGCRRKVVISMAYTGRYVLD